MAEIINSCDDENMKPNCACQNPKFRNVTHVIFDLDGVILDTEGILNGVLSEIVETYGKKISLELKHKIVGGKGIDIARIITTDLKLPISAEDFLEKFREMTYVLFPDAVFIPGVERMTKHLYENHIPMAVATSSNEKSYTIKAQNHKCYFNMFHHIICGGSDPEVKEGKPRPDIFLICASRFDDKPDPSDCLVFEDSINGVKAALNAGMQVVMIPDETVSQEQWKIATLKIDSFEQMKPELFGLPPFPP